MNEHDRARLSAYLDGVLAPPEAQALERELGARPELAAELAALRAQEAALARAFAPLVRTVAQRTRTLALPERPSARPTARPRRNAPLLWLALGAAAGVLATGT